MPKRALRFYLLSFAALNYGVLIGCSGPPQERRAQYGASKTKESESDRLYTDFSRCAEFFKKLGSEDFDEHFEEHTKRSKGPV